MRTIPKKGVFVHYTHDENHAVEEAKRQIAAMKQAGLRLEQIVSIAKEIFGEGEEND